MIRVTKIASCFFLALAGMACYATTPQCTIQGSGSLPQNEPTTIYTNGRAQYQYSITPSSASCPLNDLRAYYYYPGNGQANQGVVSLNGTSGSTLSMTTEANGFIAGTYKSGGTQAQALKSKALLKMDPSHSDAVKSIAADKNSQTLYFSSGTSPDSSNSVEVNLCYVGSPTCNALSKAYNAGTLESVIDTTGSNFFTLTLKQPPSSSAYGLMVSRASNAIAANNGAVNQSFNIVGYTYQGDTDQVSSYRFNKSHTSLSITEGDSEKVIPLFSNGTQLKTIDLGMAKLLQGDHNTPGANTTPETPWYHVSVGTQNLKVTKQVYNGVTLLEFNGNHVSIGGTSYTFTYPLSARIINAEKVLAIGYEISLDNGDGLLVTGTDGKTEAYQFKLVSGATYSTFNTLGIQTSSGVVSTFGSNSIQYSGSLPVFVSQAMGDETIYQTPDLKVWVHTAGSNTLIGQATDTLTQAEPVSTHQSLAKTSTGGMIYIDANDKMLLPFSPFNPTISAPNPNINLVNGNYANDEITDLDPTLDCPNGVNTVDIQAYTGSVSFDTGNATYLYDVQISGVGTDNVHIFPLQTSQSFYPEGTGGENIQPGWVITQSCQTGSSQQLADSN